MNVKINDDVIFGKSKPFVLIAGPCVIENDSHPLFMAEKIKIICDKLNIPFIFKSSFDKFKPSSIKSPWIGIIFDSASYINPFSPITSIDACISFGLTEVVN